MALALCFRCGFPTDPCHCEARRSFVKARVTDYLWIAGYGRSEDEWAIQRRTTPDPSNTPGPAVPSVELASTLVDTRRDSSASAGTSQPADCALEPATWHDLYLTWRQDYPDARTLSWRCTHGSHDATDGRGPIRRSQRHAHNFALTTMWHVQANRHYYKRDAAESRDGGE